MSSSNSSKEKSINSNSSTKSYGSSNYSTSNSTNSRSSSGSNSTNSSSTISTSNSPSPERLQIQLGNMIELNGKKYKILEILGEGNFGMVLKVERNRQYYVIKILKDTENYDKEKFLIEQTVLQVIKEKLDGCKEGVLCYEDSFQNGHDFIFITKYSPGVDLHKFVQIIPQLDFITVRDIEVILTNIITSYQLLEEAGVIHRDIKPSNMLINWERKGKNRMGITFVDFGFGCFDNASIHKKIIDKNIKLLARGKQSINLDTSYLNRNFQCNSDKGTLKYISPEYFFEKHATKQSDIFALGVVFLFILTGGINNIYNYDIDNIKDPVEKIVQYERIVQDPSERKNIFQLLQNRHIFDFNIYHASNLINQMIDINPRKRPTTKQILQKIPSIFSTSKNSRFKVITNQ